MVRPTASTHDTGPSTGGIGASTSDSDAPTSDIGNSTGNVGTLTDDIVASTADTGVSAGSNDVRRYWCFGRRC